MMGCRYEGTRIVHGSRRLKTKGHTGQVGRIRRYPPAEDNGTVSL